MKNIEKYGVEELSTQEMTKTNGGFFLIIFAGAIVGLIVGLLVLSDGECPEDPQ
jgi:lactobin A/cerein 7B family class IIb bacteriocin